MVLYLLKSTEVDSISQAYIIGTKLGFEFAILLLSLSRCKISHVKWKINTTLYKTRLRTIVQLDLDSNDTEHLNSK